MKNIENKSITFDTVMNERILLKKREAAFWLRTSESTIDRLRKSGDLSAIKIRGSIMFRVEELVNYLESQGV